MKVCKITMLLTWLTGAALFAQPNVGGRPVSERFPEHLTEHDRLPVNFLPKPDKSKFNSPEVANQVAVGVQAGFDLTNSGLWEQLPNGDRIWRLVVSVPDALALLPLYDRFILPPGGLLFVSNADKSVIWGGFTSANNPGPTSGYSTAMIAGQTLVFEYFEPALQRGKGQLSIDKLSYFYDQAIKNDSEYKRQAYEQHKAKQFGSSAVCHININCPTDIGADWQSEKRAVAKILIISSGGGAGLCSGALINNTALDEKPYFYSAFHCQAGGVNYDQTQFHFDYESPGCTNQDVTPNIVVGATARMTLREADTWLCELKSLPPNPYFAGWNRQDASPGVCFGISHPAGDIKKVTRFTPAFSSPAVNIGGYVVPDNSHWGMNIDKGFSQGGSSGSPLFGRSSKLIHGTLHGGSGNCANGVGSGSSYYGKFSWAWNNGGSASSRLRDWLDPLNKEFLELPSLDPREANPNIIISEIASGTLQGKTVRYLEIYNAHPDRKIRLSALSLQIQVDGSNTVQRNIALPAFDLLPGETYVVANADFDASWGLKKPDLISADLGDGNDVCVLASSSRPDAYGETGKNGTGLFWDYAGKVVSRRPSVVRPNKANFSAANFNEWEVKTLSLSNMTPGSHTARQPEVDLTVSELVNPVEGGLSCSDQIAPIVKVSNLGTQSVSSYEVTVRIGSKTAVVASTRPLAADSEELIDFSSENQLFNASIGKAVSVFSSVKVTSAQSDQVAVNDSLQTSVTLANKSGTFLIVELRTDLKPEETFWEVLSGGQVIYKRDFAGLAPNTLYTSKLCLDTAQCYVFKVSDRANNGIASPGFVRATKEGDIEPIIANAVFSGSRTVNFCMVPAPQMPTECEPTVLPGNIVRFAWRDNSFLEDGFLVQRQFTDLIPAVWEDLATVDKNKTFYNDILSASQARRRVAYRVASFRNSLDERRVVSRYCEMSNDLLSINKTESSLTLYPNPTTGTLQIKTQEISNGSAQLLVFDVLGKKVFDSGVELKQGEAKIDLSTLPKGIYTLKLQTDFGLRLAQMVME